MPKYKFKCEKCDTVKTLFVVDRKNYTPPECDEHGAMRKIPSTTQSVIKERDKTRNKNIKRGTTEELKKRSHEHFMKHEVDDLIQKHGPKQAKEFGWLDEKGKKRRLIDEK